MTNMKNRRVTSFEVARAAGVSRAAVSRAFTPDASVSEETREKVFRAAKSLGYRVNYLARSLTNQRSDLVGVVVAGADNPFRALQVDHIARALLARNFRPILLPTDEGEAKEVIGQLLHYSVSGVLVTSDAPPTELCEECAAHGVPIVLINKGDDIPLVDRVISDNDGAGELAARTLLEAGARRLAVMCARDKSYTARCRHEAFMAFCAASGVDAQTVDLSRNDYESGRAKARILKERGIDGLFCINDYMACGVIDGLSAGGWKVPDDIRIVGHDDIPQAGWSAYDLTTIVQPCDTQAHQAIDLLESRMKEHGIESRTEYTPVSLKRRRTA